MMKHVKTQTYGQTARRLFGVLMEQRWRVVAVVVCAIVYSFFTIMGPLATSIVIDRLFEFSQSGVRAQHYTEILGVIGQPLTMVLIIYLTTSLASYVQEYLTASLAQNVSFNLRKAMSQKVNRLPLAFFDSQQTGESMSRVTNDLENVALAIQTSTVQLLTSVFTIIGSFIMMARLNLTLLGITVFFALVSLVATKIVSHKTLLYSARRQHDLGVFNGIIEEQYTGRLLTKAFNREPQEYQKMAHASNNLYETNVKAEFFMHIMNPMVRFINRMGYVAVGLLSGLYAIRGLLSVGGIQAFIQYSNQFTEPLVQATYSINALQSGLASAHRIFDFLDTEDAIADAIDAVDFKAENGAITFEHVQFGYGDTLLMNDINIDINAGEMVAVVGPTGAGKTTLVNILMRFYELKGGVIRIDGVLTDTMTRGSLRRNFAMVLQDTWLFEGSIADNIAYGKPGATRDEVIAAAKASRADHFIRTMPHGYDSVIGNSEGTLSAGQRQLLTIARAMLADPTILILDEATSSVDTKTEVEIQDAMGVLMSQRTSIVIAHRLSTILNADKILVMDHGNIIEQGTHQELLDLNGVYNALYQSQFAD